MKKLHEAQAFPTTFHSMSTLISWKPSDFLPNPKRDLVSFENSTSPARPSLPACLEGCLRFSAAAEMAIKDEEPAGIEVKLEDSWNWLGIFVTWYTESCDPIIVGMQFPSENDGKMVIVHVCFNRKKSCPKNKVDFPFGYFYCFRYFLSTQQMRLQSFQKNTPNKMGPYWLYMEL